jgi:hypothetical protein
MEEGQDFTNQMAAALMQKAEYLDKKRLPRLKELFMIYLSSYQTIYNVLLKKGLIQEDEYPPVSF